MSATENRGLLPKLRDRILPKKYQEILCALRPRQLEVGCPSGAASMAFQATVSKKPAPVLRDDRDESVFYQLRLRERLSRKAPSDAP